MDTDFIAYESMLAAKYAADWTKQAAIAGYLSLITTIIATIVAFVSINSWKNQEKVKEVKELSLSVFKFQMQISLMASEFLDVTHSIDDVKKSMYLLSGLDEVYKCTIIMHNKKMRTQASELYSSLLDIFERHIKGSIKDYQAVAEIVIIRTQNNLLNHYS